MAETSDDDDDCGITCGLKVLLCCKNECETNDERERLIQEQPKKAKNSSKNSLQKEVNEKKKTVTELKQEKERKLQRATELVIVHYDHKEIEELKGRRKELDTHEFQDCEVYGNITDIMIEKMITEYISSLLNCSEGEEQSGVNQKEQYKIYGLLLSAIGKDMRRRVEPEAILKEVEDSVSDISGLDLNEEVIIGNVNSSVELTHSMLILLPPLLLIQPQWQHNDVQDTNRKTWDEEQRDRPLIYYRPVLVHGNQLNVDQLNVAVRGLVGNTNTTV